MSTNQAYRQICRRVFASELSEATHSFTEEDRERAPKYLLLPTGEKANRVFMIGAAPTIDKVGNSDNPMFQTQLKDGTGNILVTATQYQPEPRAVMRELQDECPCWIAVDGKARLIDNDDGPATPKIEPDTIWPIPESGEGMPSQYLRWVHETATRTKARIDAFDQDHSYARMVVEEYGISSLEPFHQSAHEVNVKARKEVEALG